MPPKAGKGGQAASKKTENKKKEKIIEDKTFGLKNKKGGKQQKFIQQVQKQVHTGGTKSAKQLEKEKEQAKLAKEDKKKELNEINQLFKPVQQLVTKGVDPKSVLCAFYKQGQCTKGAKCKFAHDLAVERKSEKRSAFVDVRRENQTNEDWDEDMLKEVIEKKQQKNMPTSDIICKYFLNAVENCKYGWFWECPNGTEKCIYRHALPPGYVLKKDKKRMEKQTDEISLEELIEKERAALGHNTTRVTLQSFLIWKKKKLKEREEKNKSETAKKKSDYKSGKEGGISGREMFTFDPSLINKAQEMDDDDAEFDLKNMEKDEENGDDGEDRFEFKEIDVNSFMAEYEAEMNSVKNSQNNETNKKIDEINGEGAVAIDEDLFEEDDEDLQELDEQLNEMNIS